MEAIRSKAVCGAAACAVLAAALVIAPAPRAASAEDMIQACWHNPEKSTIYHSIRFPDGGRHDFVLGPYGEHRAKIPPHSTQCYSYDPIRGSDCPFAEPIDEAVMRRC
jgi:hypothetical protein